MVAKGRFADSEEAKNYVARMTSGHLSKDQLLQRISDYERYRDMAYSKEDADFWVSQIDGAKQWMASPEFESGSFPQAIDTLFFDLVELRSLFYAFGAVSVQNNPFDRHYFYKQWMVGNVYAVFCMFSKLISNDKRDNSLRNIWSDVSQYIYSDAFLSEDEVKLITNKLDQKNGQLTNMNSTAVKFRNKVIAHNESSHTMLWPELDEDIRLVSRVWSVLTSWSSFGVIKPWRDAEEVFSGLESTFAPDEISSLRVKRKEYIEMVENWCITSLHTDQKSDPRGPFATISISLNV